MKKNKFKSIPFSEIKREALKNPGVRKAYNELQFDFQIIRALIDARSKKGMTQKKLANKIGVAQSALARFESGRINPRLDFIRKVTSGLGLRLVVR